MNLLEVNITAIYERIRRCEEQIKNHGELLSEPLKIEIRSPHLCPLCCGNCETLNEYILPGHWLGKFNRQDKTGTYDLCKVCNGKGIVWG